MTHPLSPPWKPEREIDLDFLATHIHKRLLPFAFSCECGGAEPSCAWVLKDPYNAGLKDTLENVVRIIRSFKMWVCPECNHPFISESEARRCAREDKVRADVSSDYYHGDGDDDEE